MNKLKNYISLNLLSISGWIALIGWFFVIYFVFLSKNSLNYFPQDTGALLIFISMCLNCAFTLLFILSALVEYVIKSSSPSLPKENPKFKKISSTKIYSILFFIGIALGLIPIIFVLYAFLS